ncbi:hypothetical protein KP78_13500 [Jeotgalibacillus soli]|uniref:Uncharacterized protein n=1 Tax=Jeotgalibacillus soli TaxID=889306 RepID=A0A0C2VLT6_9BACL|nr:hypothetical protein KP78_13500 [Jeotgalibacillus soli]
MRTNEMILFFVVKIKADAGSAWWFWNREKELPEVSFH